MKKFIVSSLVLLSFISYSFYQRILRIQEVPVVTPKPTMAPTDISLPGSTTTQQSVPTNTPMPNPKNTYKDGMYSGSVADAFYGLIQVQATISNGRITDIKFLQAPNDRGTSIEINRQADPLLAQEAIQAQSAKVDVISGATDSSQAFIQSLQSALDKAKSYL